MAEKLMYILNSNIQKYPFCIIQLVVETFRHSTNEPINQNLRLDKLTNRKRLIKNFRDECNKQPNVPSLPYISTIIILRSKYLFV